MLVRVGFGKELGRTNDMVGIRTKAVTDGCARLGVDRSINAKVGRRVS